MKKKIALFLPMMLLALASCHGKPSTTTVVPITPSTSKPTETIKPTETVIVPSTSVPTHIHEYTVSEDKPSSCITYGSTKYTCSCGEMKVELKKELGAHALVHHEAKAATEEASGNIEYWQCSVCFVKFSDANATTTVTETTIPKLVHEHSYAIVSNTESTCKSYGMTVSKCSCGEQKIESKTELGAHKLTHVEAKTATEEATGNIEYWICSVCNKTFSDAEGKTEVKDVTVSKLVHTHVYQKTGETDSTCMVQGSITSSCTCGATTSETKPFAAHTLVHHEAKTPTDTTNGNIEYWECSVCQKKFSDAEAATLVTDVSIPMTGHTHSYLQDNDVASTCITYGSIHYSCTCGEEKTEIKTSLGAHTLVHHEAVAATQTSTGTIEYWECSVCHQKFSDAEGKNSVTEIITPKLTSDETGTVDWLPWV